MKEVPQGDSPSSAQPYGARPQAGVARQNHSAHGRCLCLGENPTRALSLTYSVLSRSYTVSHTVHSTVQGCGSPRFGSHPWAGPG